MSEITLTADEAVADFLLLARLRSLDPDDNPVVLILNASDENWRRLVDQARVHTETIDLQAFDEVVAIIDEWRRTTRMFDRLLRGVIIE